ncbi:hypothetical protein QNL75_27050 [Pseudomonas amygdali pv. morsprunorum]|nr:hypothetical protein [Pseudomonas amygdali]MDT3268717.1 hypothetical protein [Pseudomonas amygdali pv. morsprunorum]
MTRMQRIWVRQQSSFEKMADSNTIFTKCGKRFDCFDDYYEWVLNGGEA